MIKYVKDRDGKTHKIDFFCVIENGKTYLYVDNYKMCHLKVYYRHERTWDDHMGNTPCGYYCNVPIVNHFGKPEYKRVYMF